MKRYTIGFIFTPDLTRVLLIHKLAPAWQVGKMNWPGGKVEEGEDCYQCVSREIREETGLIQEPALWQKVAALHSEDFHVDVLSCLYHWEESDAKSLEAEQVEWFDVASLPTNTVNTLPWLIPMCVGIHRNLWIDVYAPGERFFDIECAKNDKEISMISWLTNTLG